MKTGELVIVTQSASILTKESVVGMSGQVVGKRVSQLPNGIEKTVLTIKFGKTLFEAAELDCEPFCGPVHLSVE